MYLCPSFVKQADFLFGLGIPVSSHNVSYTGVYVRMGYSLRFSLSS